MDEFGATTLTFKSFHI